MLQHVDTALEASYSFRAARNDDDVPSMRERSAACVCTGPSKLSSESLFGPAMILAAVVAATVFILMSPALMTKFMHVPGSLRGAPRIIRVACTDGINWNLSVAVSDGARCINPSLYDSYHRSCASVAPCTSLHSLKRHTRCYVGFPDKDLDLAATRWRVNQDYNVKHPTAR